MKTQKNPTPELDAPRALSPHLRYFQQHGEVFGYHNLFGYLLQMSPDLVELLEFHRGRRRSRKEAAERFAGRWSESELGGFLDVLGEWSCLVTDPEPEAEMEELWSMIPVRARWVVFHQPSEEELWFWRTDRQGHSERDEAPIWAARIWSRIDNKKTLRKLFEEVEEDPSLGELRDPKRAVLREMASWVHADRQYLRFARTPPPRSEKQWPSYLRSAMPYAPWRPGIDPLPPNPLLPLATPVAPPHRYYEEEVADAERQFRETETTLSHLLRKPHPLLGGSTYSQRLAEALVREGLLVDRGEGPFSILEIGAGLGHLAEGVLGHLRAQHPALFARVRYTILDLSPTLRAAQAGRLRAASLLDKVSWLGANAERVELPEAAFDLVLSNEVIGDLTTVKLSRELLGLSDERKPAESYEALSAETLTKLGSTGWILKLYEVDLSDSPPEFFFNVGAIELIEKLSRSLRPGGGAFLSEYGERSHYPIAGTHLDHIEFSIHFAPLIQVAERLGLKASLHQVQDLIGLDRSAQTLATTRTYFSSLRAMFASFGRELDKIAYTREMFQALLSEREDGLSLEHLGDLRFHPVDERCMGLAPHEFKALLLRKP